MPRAYSRFQKVCQEPDRQGGPDQQALLMKGIAGVFDDGWRVSRASPLLTRGLLTLSPRPGANEISNWQREFPPFVRPALIR